MCSHIVAAFLLLLFASAFSLELIPFLEKSLVIESMSRTSASESCPSVLACFSCVGDVTTVGMSKDTALMRRQYSQENAACVEPTGLVVNSIVL